MATSGTREGVDSFPHQVLDKTTLDTSNDSYLPVVQYIGKVRPVLSVDTLTYRYGVAVERTTGYIYVAEQNTNSVLVYNAACEYLFVFESDQMMKPLCIAIYKEKVFVTQYEGGCVLLFSLNGKFIRRIGTPGSGEGQFNNPYGIAIHNTNGDIYICDFSNTRIQIFSNDYSFKCQFGKKLPQSPVDIQLTQCSIFVLSYENPFLYAFNYDLTQVSSIVCDIICKHLSTPNSLFIDGAGNFIIADYISNTVVIFDKTGQLMHKLTDSISQPFGVTLNSHGSIIVVGHSNKLLIF